MIRKLTLALCVLALGSASSRAALVYDTTVTPDNYTGSRNVSSGQLISGGDWGDTDNETIAWVITDNGDGTWTYQYTFTNFSAPGISHWILDLSDDAVDIKDKTKPLDPEVVTDVTPSGKLEWGQFGPHPSNPGFPAGFSIIGVKFDYGAGTLTFDSNRAPVWGDVYVKGGNDSFVYNKGLTLHATSQNILDFIARPNGKGPHEVVPEPSTVLACGLGIGLVGLARLRRMRRGA